MTLKSFPKAQSGVALVMVLLAFALIASLASGILVKQNLLIQRVANQIFLNQGLAFTQGAETFALAALKKDFEEDKRKNKFIDHEEELWAKYSAAFPMEGGLIRIQLDDLNGRFNLNDLVDDKGQVDPEAQKRLTQLLQNLEITEVSADRFVDWIDPNDEPTGAYGAEDNVYLLKDPPYRAANRPMVSLSELFLLEGMTREAYDKLVPHLTVLPARKQGLNVNAITAEVIRTLHPSITAKQAEDLIAARKESEFETVEAFLARPEFAGLGLKKSGLDVRSSFFEASARVDYGDRIARMVTLIYRDKDGKLSVLSRDLGQKNRITKPVLKAE